jgi:hypothetical protein
MATRIQQTIETGIDHEDDFSCLFSTHAHPAKWRNGSDSDWLDFGNRLKNPAVVLRDAQVYERVIHSVRPIGLSGLVSFDDTEPKRERRVGVFSRFIRALIDEPTNKLRLRRTFSTLKKQWKSDTKYLSSSTDMVLHPSYQRIIGLGPDVIPIILEEMISDPDHWFWALEALTGENPVLPENVGRVGSMTDAWVKWGKEKKLI